MKPSFSVTDTEMQEKPSQWNNQKQSLATLQAIQKSVPAMVPAVTEMLNPLDKFGRGK
jgi:hypothetical protein